MRAMVYRGPYKVRVEDKDVPLDGNLTQHIMAAKLDDCIK